MQRYTIFFIIVNALHASGGFSAHNQELKNWTHSNSYVPGLLVATTSAREFQLIHASGSSKQAWHIPDAVCTVFKLLMMGEKTPEICRALTIIKDTVQRCILLVMLKRM